MTYTTQCPNCQTRFKVNDAQLSAANGLVRCGRCTHVFKAPDHFVSPEPAPAPAPLPPSAPVETPPPAPALQHDAAPAADPADDFELEMPDFDPGAAQDAAEESPLTTPQEEPAAPSANSEAEEFQRALAEALSHRPAASRATIEPLTPPEDAPLPEVFGNNRRKRDEDSADAPATEPAAPVFALDEPPAPPAAKPRSAHHYGDLGLDEEAREEEVAPRRRHPALNILMGVLGMLGVLLVAGQLVYFNRTRIAAEVPEMRPTLESLCKAAGCAVPWPTDVSQIRTEWSELAFVPDHPNLIQLSATLKNHASFAQTYPMLELSLKDADDQVLIRKVFTPKEYLKADDLKLQHFNPNSEVKITMRLDAGKVRAMGYSLYWFYP